MKVVERLTSIIREIKMDVLGVREVEYRITDIAKITGMNPKEVDEWINSLKDLFPCYIQKGVDMLLILDIIIYYCKTRGHLPKEEVLASLLICAKNGINPFLI
ncbi:hypothetical protein FKG96_12565 [Olivibacter sp. LS-1]|uniref:hypothetical protein n=1 Tax=Olivibacter sp. LS-1 TaxID=2592345 RepID=UPI0011EA9197|nr:hypothetical protein [Olivibacter sp. LS-1]QEL01605.1 hypothetical protein FKG96_12565 [Olivibacter sp. LS-1]